jgi:thioredoxin-like negative regulator of GroEL
VLAVRGAAPLYCLRCRREPLVWPESEAVKILLVQPPHHDPAFAFPYRPESLPVLEWAVQNNDEWVWTWLLALNLWALDRDAEAATCLDALGQEPDFGPFYVARAHLLGQRRGTDPEPDLRRAVALAPEDRTVHIQLIRHLQEVEEWDSALLAVDAVSQRFPEDFNLDLLEAQTLIHLGRAEDAAQILAATRVLPSEHARDSHRLWERAHTLAALDAMETGEYLSADAHLAAALEWPESLGQGRPDEPEERLVSFLQGITEEALGNDEAAREAFEAVVDATGELDWPLTRLDLLVVSALEDLGRGDEAEELTRSRGDEMDTLYADLDTDLDGRMILRALQQNGR